MKIDTKWITRTAMFLALVILAQFIGSRMSAGGLMGQLVTGSLVNMLLIVSGIVAGISSGLVIAIISPILASLLGIGPTFPQIIPVIMLGNVIIVVLTYTAYRTLSKSKNAFVRQGGILLGFFTSGAVKAGFLWLGVVKVVLPMLTQLKPAQVDTLSLMFSWPQLLTAMIGSLVAIVVLPSMLRIKQQAAR